MDWDDTLLYLKNTTINEDIIYGASTIVDFHSVLNRGR